MRPSISNRVESSDSGSTRPRLAILVTHPMTAVSVLRGQLGTLAKSGLDVRLICSPGRQADEVRDSEGVSVHPVEMEREISVTRDLASLAAVRKELSNLNPVIVSSGTPKAGLLGTLGAYTLGIKHRVYTVRGLRLETARGFKRLILWSAERASCSLSNRVVAVSESLKQRLISMKLAPESKIEVLGSGSSNGVDCSRFDAARIDDSSLEDLRRRLHLEPSNRLVLFIGRLTRDKGIVELVEAFEKLWRRKPDVRLCLVGAWERGDPIPPRVREKVDSHPAISHVDFAAAVEEYYGLASVVAFPSHREGFPNVVLEAAAVGRPVVGARATGTVDAIVDGTTGTLVPINDADALGAALENYLENDDLAREHGLAAARRARALFERERVWKQWVDFYWGLLRR